MLGGPDDHQVRADFLGETVQPAGRRARGESLRLRAVLVGQLLDRGGQLLLLGVPLRLEGERLHRDREHTRNHELCARGVGDLPAERRRVAAAVVKVVAGDDLGEHWKLLWSGSSIGASPLRAASGIGNTPSAASVVARRAVCGPTPMRPARPAPRVGI